MTDGAAASARGRGAESSAGTPPAAFDRVRALERAEHEADVVRLRRIFQIGVVVWPAYGVLDRIVVRFESAGPFSFFFWLRVVGEVPLLGEQASPRFTAAPAAEAARTTEPELGARPEGATFTRTQIS